MITCGLVQASSKASLLENFETIKHYVIQAAQLHYRILCFPECFLTGYSSRDALALSISKKHTIFDRIQALAVEYDLDLLVGYIEQEPFPDQSLSESKSACSLYITHDIFTSDGRRFSYRKTHLGDREAKVFSPGDCLPVYPLGCGLTAAIQLCVENHYPEITQTYSLKGADIVFAPHAVPRISGDRLQIWSKFIPARAYDNRVYMACCNQWGGSMAVTPSGEIIGTCNTETDTLLPFDIEKHAVKQYHEGSSKMSARYYPSRRRPELYQ